MHHTSLASTSPSDPTTFRIYGCVQENLLGEVRPAQFSIRDVDETLHKTRWSYIITSQSSLQVLV